VRVTLVRSDVAGAASFAEALFRILRFNGKAAVDNAGLYSEVLVPTGALDPHARARIADRIAETSPSVVVMQGDAALAQVVQLVEQRMSNAHHKPTYLAAVSSPETFAPFIGTSADRRHRVYTVDSSSDSVPNARFVLRYNERHEKHATRVMNGGEGYDAFYLLAYASFALGNGPVTGTELAKAFGRLVGPGRSIVVGPSDVFDALTALDRGDSIDLEGTHSGLDFDLNTGDAPSDFVLLCSGVDATGHATGEVESGIVYEAATRKLAGVLRCP
jgi:hypothetical protein